MDKQIALRAIRPEDTDILQTFLYHAIHVPEGMEPPPRSILEKPELQVYIDGFGDRPHDHGLAAVKNGQVIGAAWVRDMPDYGHIEDGVPSFAVSVLPGQRGKGVGTLLMQTLLEQLGCKGYARASLAVQKTNRAAALYRRLGFETLRETDEEYLMVCPLGVHTHCRTEKGGSLMPNTDHSRLEILDNELSADDFIRLFAAAGWGEPPADLTHAALAGSYAVFSARLNGQTVAMARLLGDGAMSFFLKDFVVHPAVQGRGVGKALFDHVEDYIRKQLKPGWHSYLELSSAPGKEGFYERLGFAAYPNEQNGSGMSKWIHADEG